MTDKQRRFMQVVVPFEGGPLHGHQVVWSDNIYHFNDYTYRTVYAGTANVPEKYILDTTSAAKPFLPLYSLVIPNCIYELEPARQRKVFDQLQALINSAVTKYVVGQKEHGGKLEDRPCFDEMHNEILDLMWYWYAEKERRDNKLSGMTIDEAKKILNR